MDIFLETMHYDCYFYLKRYPAVNALITILATSLQLNEMGAMFVTITQEDLRRSGQRPFLPLEASSQSGMLFVLQTFVLSTNSMHNSKQYNRKRN